VFRDVEEVEEPVSLETPVDEVAPDRVELEDDEATVETEWLVGVEILLVVVA